MIIDSHQHFWNYDPVRHNWIEESMAIIRKDFLPQDLAPILEKNKVDGCIAVQVDQTEAETQYLLDLAAENTFIKGVVGWVDLRDSNVALSLAHFAKNPLFKGVRHIVQAENIDFMQGKEFVQGIKALQKHQLTYDILIHHKQLPSAIKLATNFPEQVFVLDHIAKPDIKNKEIINWASNIEQLALLPNVYCKVSGIVTEADFTSWTPADITPYLEIIFNAFSIDKLLFGSDWPVCLCAAEYATVLDLIKDFSASYSLEEKEKLFSKNAIKAYNLNL